MAQKFDAEFSGELRPRYNIAPTQPVPVVCDRRSGKAKQPFHLSIKDESLFAFAGIWDRWKPPAGSMVEPCAILTTTPSELLSDVHDRMPVILRPEHYEAWLSAPSGDTERRARSYRTWCPSVAGSAQSLTRQQP
jgi:putative SOS response-associated peptidase YedK